MQHATPLAAPWLATAVEHRPHAELRPAPNNPRAHSAEQVDQLARSIAAFGFNNPVLVDATGEIIAGEGRWRAARRLGLERVPVIVLDHLTAEQRAAFLVADNKIAEGSTWDDARLADLMRGLQLADFDMPVLGFDADELADLLEPAPPSPPKTQASVSTAADDAVPALPKVPATRRGDIWICGRHRVMCGDSTDKAAVAALLGGKNIDAVFADPPYCSGGFQESARKAGSVGTRDKVRKVANDTLSTRGYQALMKAALLNYPAGVVYLFTDWRMWVNLFDLVEASGFGVRHMIVWDKGSPGMGVGWRAQHEIIMCGVSGASPFDKKTAQGNVIRCKRSGNVSHPTEKPVELLETVIAATPAAKSWADMFLGSGSILIAAEKQKRAAFGMELTPAFTDVAVQRWQEFAGETAVHAETGETFAERLGLVTAKTPIEAAIAAKS
jgi:DNA modification methylase